MTQQGKEMRGGAHEDFAYHSVKLVLLANGNSRYQIDSKTFPVRGEVHYPFKILHCPNSDLF